jgi:hypothetical protein
LSHPSQRADRPRAPMYHFVRAWYFSFVQSSSAWAKGFAISSLPSTGLMSTSSVPLATTRPRCLVPSLPSSSATSVLLVYTGQPIFGDKEPQTSQCLLSVVEHEVHQRIEALEDTLDCSANVSRSAGSEGRAGRHTFAPTVELDADLLVHVLAQIEDVLLLGPLLVAASSTAASTAAAMATSSVA